LTLKSRNAANPLLLNELRVCPIDDSGYCATLIHFWDTITGTRYSFTTPLIAPKPSSTYHLDPDRSALLAWRTQAASQQRRDKA
jgi:hypothetical protein